MKGAGEHVLVVDDEQAVRQLLCRLVRQEGYEPLEAADGETALALIRRQPPDLVLLDIKLPGIDGMEVLRQAKKLDRDLPVVMVTSNGQVRDAVAALRAGAHDYLVKPFEHADVIRSLHSARTARGLRRTIQRLSVRSPEAAWLRERMGPSDAISRVCADVVRVAASDFTVLIIGETGTGKELVAQAVHQFSPRSALPFVPVDCGAVPETLFESELFGHRRGAFTGADRNKPGKFELAGAGTLFLDEIGNMPLTCQAKLLRAVQERAAYPVGGTVPIAIEARLLAASNTDLDAAVAKGRFREDLYFRLNEFVIAIPPLRERPADIIYLIRRFIDETNRELGKSVEGVSERAMEQLLASRWPGNVRQLRTVIRRAVLLAERLIEEQHLSLKMAPASVAGEPMDAPLALERESLKELVRRTTASVEKTALLEALRKTGGNKAEAARLLRIDYKTVLTKAKEYGLAPVRPYHRRQQDE